MKMLQREEQTSMPPEHAARGNILVVDDTPENLAILTSMLVERGYLVRPAINGEVALKAVERHAPDLILLDIMMPRMSGFEVCEALKADEGTRHIPVIFISALHKIEDKVKAFALGGVDYITKPFQLEEVLARVETHIALLRLNRELQANNARLEEQIRKREEAEIELKHSLNQIERAKREWEITADSLSSVVCLLDRQARILRVNRTIEHWKLADVQEVKGQSIHGLMHPACHDAACYLRAFLAHAWEEVSQGISIGCEEYDGLLKRHVGIQLRPISAHLDQQNDPLATNFAVAVIRDITRPKQAENGLKRHNAMLDALNQMSDRFQECRSEPETYAVVASICRRLFPIDSGALYLNDGSTPTLRLVSCWVAGSAEVAEDAEASRFPCAACLSRVEHDVRAGTPAESRQLCQHLASAPEFGYLCLPIRAVDQILGLLYIELGSEDAGGVNADGELIIESRQMMISRVAKHYALALSNVRLREKLRMEAIRDPLTGLYNRRYMEESLERETQRARRRGTSVGILLFDIDHFKMLNDTHGHEAGDKVLEKLGRLFRQHTRSEDVACRYGGEEFLLILPETTLDIVRHRAEELRVLIKDRLRIAWRERLLSVTISVGVAAFPQHGAAVKPVVSAADGALYQAKRQGRDCVIVAPG